VGGSLPSEGREKKILKGEKQKGRAPKGKDATTVKADDFLIARLPVHRSELLAGSNHRGADWKAREQAKAEIATILAEKTGIPEEDINCFIFQWAQSSNNDDMRSLAIQQDASKEFGVELSEFTRDKISAKQAYTKEQMDALRSLGWTEGGKKDITATADWERGHPLMESSKQRALLRAMYDNTQEKLSAAGFKPEATIRLRRGVRLPRSEMTGWKEGDIKSIKGNALGSWSIERDAARSFATGGGFEQRGVVFEMDVPVSSIIGSARTGFGCLREGEFVTAGADGEAKVIFLTGE